METPTTFSLDELRTKFLVAYGLAEWRMDACDRLHLEHTSAPNNACDKVLPGVTWPSDNRRIMPVREMFKDAGSFESADSRANAMFVVGVLADLGLGVKVETAFVGDAASATVRAGRFRSEQFIAQTVEIAILNAALDLVPKLDEVRELAAQKENFVQHHAIADWAVTRYGSAYAPNEYSRKGSSWTWRLTNDNHWEGVSFEERLSVRVPFMHGPFYAVLRELARKTANQCSIDTPPARPVQDWDDQYMVFVNRLPLSEGAAYDIGVYTVDALDAPFYRVWDDILDDDLADHVHRDLIDLAHPDEPERGLAALLDMTGPAHFRLDASPAK